MKKQIYLSGSILILIAAILWGLDGVIRKSLFNLAPITIVFFEHFIGLLLISPFFINKILELKLTSKEWLAIIWVSLLSGLLGTLWFTTALAKTSFIPFSVVFLIQKLQPLFAISFAHILLKEKLNPNYKIWSATALLAAYFVTFKNGYVNFNTGSQTFIAAMYALGAAFAWGSSTAISRFALLKQSHTTLTGLRFLFTTLLSLPILIISQPLNQLTLPDQNQLVRLVFIALSTGLVALWIYYLGLKRTPAKISTIIELAFPLTAVVIDIFIYHSFLSISQYVAAFILMFAIFKISQIAKIPHDS